MLYVAADSLPKTDFLTHIDVMIIITMGTLVTQGGAHCLLIAGVAGEDMLATTNARIAAGLLGAYTLSLAAIFLPARHRYNRQVGEWSADPAPEEATRVSAQQNFGFGAASEEHSAADELYKYSYETTVAKLL